MKGGSNRGVVVRNLQDTIQETRSTSVCCVELSVCCHFTLDDMDEMRIVILGKTGTGKSSLANTIFGKEKVFEIGDSGNSETSECRSETGRVDGRDVTLIDTPGLFDTNRPEKELRDETLSCIVECSPGPHAFLLVFNVGKFTDQEQEVIKKIRKYFSEEAFKFATLVFTHGDQLKEGQTIEEYYRTNQRMSDLMKKCGGRCHVIDNKYWKDKQPDEYRSNQFHVKQLLKTIDHMMEANKGSCYTNEMLQAVEALIQEEEEEIRQSSGDMSNKEIRKKAKKKVLKKLLIGLTVVTAGALLGAFLGAVVLAPVEVAVGSAVAVYVLAGAIKKGYDAFEKESILEAAKAVFNRAASFFKDQGRNAEDESESKPFFNPDS